MRFLKATIMNHFVPKQKGVERHTTVDKTLYKTKKSCITRTSKNNPGVNYMHK